MKKEKNEDKCSKNYLQITSNINMSYRYLLQFSWTPVYFLLVNNLNTVAL
jgi:phage-related protein